MSVNLTLQLHISNIPAETTESVLDAAKAVLVEHQIANDVVLTARTGEVQGITPYPMIISRSYLWCPKVEADLTAAVAALAPDAKCEITWDSPDEM